MEKIIIDEGSLRHFINKISPGTCSSLTRIDFRALDNVRVKPIGVYGSREKIVEMFLEVGSIEPHQFVIPIPSNTVLARHLQPCSANALLTSGDSSLVPHLRSGIYFVQPSSPSHEDSQVFVVYWPEGTTWDDNAVSSVRRNRVMFMRYHREPPHKMHSITKL